MSDDEGGRHHRRKAIKKRKVEDDDDEDGDIVMKQDNELLKTPTKKKRSSYCLSADGAQSANPNEVEVVKKANKDHPVNVSTRGAGDKRTTTTNQDKHVVTTR